MTRWQMLQVTKYAVARVQGFRSLNNLPCTQRCRFQRRVLAVGAPTAPRDRPSRPSRPSCLPSLVCRETVCASREEHRYKGKRLAHPDVVFNGGSCHLLEINIVASKS